MEAKLQKWGNSLGIRIPNSLLKSLKVSVGDILELKEEDNRIIITKRKNEVISLEKLFKEYHGKNLAKDFEWDDAKGKEIW